MVALFTFSTSKIGILVVLKGPVKQEASNLLAADCFA